MAITRVYESNEMRLSVHVNKHGSKGYVLSGVEVHNRGLLGHVLDRLGCCWVNSGFFWSRIDPDHFWINNSPVGDLKQFEWSQLPLNSTRCNITVRNQNVYLQFLDQAWCKNREIKVNLTCGKFKGDYSILRCLKVIGLKKFLNNTGDFKTETPFEDWLLSYNKDELINENTLRECGLVAKAKLVLKPEAPIKRSGYRQKATGGSYESTTKFKRYLHSIEEKIDIVCHIRSADEGLGTGFLIGRDWIMTNAHVISKVKENHRAIFFHEEEGKKQIEIPLFEVVHSSPCSDGIEGNHIDALDFSIIKLNTNNLNPDDAKRFEHLMKIADPFFRPNGCSVKELKQSRANIIQHPQSEENQDCVKRIAFRENRIKNVDQFHLHYESETRGGSSGSPVISDEGKFVGLHVSVCMMFTQSFFNKLENLFQECGFTFETFDEYYSCTTKKGSALKIYHHGQNIGMWCHKEKSGKSTNGKAETLHELLELIVDEQEKPLQGTLLHDWKCNFLKKHRQARAIGHIYCNTAVRADRIFDNLTAAREKRIGKLKHYIPDLSEQPVFSSAQLFWLQNDTLEKVICVVNYLKKEKLILQGVEANGNCYFQAFLKSYETLQRKTPILEKISYLRSLVSILYQKRKQDTQRAETIKKDGERITSDEGGLLANALNVHIRTITVTRSKSGCSISDMLTFTDEKKKSQEWNVIDKSKKPEEYILIVDLEGHFVTAKPNLISSQDEPLISSQDEPQKSNITHILDLSYPKSQTTTSHEIRVLALEPDNNWLFVKTIGAVGLACLVGFGLGYLYNKQTIQD